ncbi:VOC family protein [Thalassobius sp. MITS945101]|uniref:VOC family protein n=1 Tax=Thalassobius sp. MITS945101 TaxID=3096994 RepID=UPI003999D368
MLVLDHLAVASNSLAEGAAFVAEKLGITMAPGGQHPRFGTHNLLIGLEDDLYLEVIAIDPEAKPPKDPRWFDLDSFEGPPRLHNWIVRCDDMSAALPQLPDGAGRAVALARGDLRWKMAVPETGKLPFDEVCPALIEWQGRHPAASLPQSGARLKELVLRHPAAAALAAQIQPVMQDVRLRFETAAVPAMRACFEIDGEHRWL